MRTATITIDTATLSHNLDKVKTLASNAHILAMVKADAYGHGVENCLSALQHADGIGVASFEEAKQARLLGWDKAIVLIEGVFSAKEWEQALAFECQSVVHHLPQVDWLLANLPASDSPSRTIWLKLNSGMNRLGFKPSDILDVAKRLNDAGYELILTNHFANADVIDHPLNKQQINAFMDVLQKLRQNVSPSIKASLCNSAGIIHFPECHLDWVRPGIMLYGSSPIETVTADDLNLKAVMTFQAKLITIDEMSIGDSVGYGSRFIADKPMTKGVISIGYGDGYPRVVNNTSDARAWVSLHQDGNVYRCPIIGRISMDMTVIDLTEVPNPKLDSLVTLWGDASKGMPTVDEIAASANTIGYELLCRVTQRPVRRLI